MFAEVLRDRLAGLVELSPDKIGVLEAHYGLLLRWNRTLNLTTIKGLESIVERHYCESLFVGRSLGSSVLRICDVGSGPGFPGFPLAVARPDCSVTLIESHQRKAVFLKEACRNVGNVRVVARRAEEVGAGFDWVVSRAVSYEDLSRSVSRLAGKIALLTGAEPPPESLEYSWEASVPLPWGRQRFLRVGSRR